jgi:hypothetical protein
LLYLYLKPDLVSRVRDNPLTDVVDECHGELE